MTSQITPGTAHSIGWESQGEENRAEEDQRLSRERARVPRALQQHHMSHPQALPGEGQGLAGLWSVWRWEGVLGFRNPLGHYLEPKTVFMAALTPHTFCLDWWGSQEAHISRRVTVIDWCQSGESSVLLDEAKESLPRSRWSPLWGACLSCHCHSCHLQALWGNFHFLFWGPVSPWSYMPGSGL